MCGRIGDLHLAQMVRAVGVKAECAARVRFDRLDNFLPGKPIWIYDTQVWQTVPVLSWFGKT